MASKKPEGKMLENNWNKNGIIQKKPNVQKNNKSEREREVVVWYPDAFYRKYKIKKTKLLIARKYSILVTAVGICKA